MNEIDVKNPNYEEISNNLRVIANDLKWTLSELQEYSSDAARLKEYAYYLDSLSDYFIIAAYDSKDVV